MLEKNKGWSRAEILALIGLALVGCQLLLTVLTYLRR